jgi:hypothetical protein
MKMTDFNLGVCVSVKTSVSELWRITIKIGKLLSIENTIMIRLYYKLEALNYIENWFILISFHFYLKLFVLFTLVGFDCV